MKMNRLFALSLLPLLFTLSVSAQQSNLNVDYSAYMPEVRALNKVISNFPHTGTVLTKEGLQNARSVMGGFGKGKNNSSAFYNYYQGSRRQYEFNDI